MLTLSPSHSNLSEQGSLPPFPVLTFHGETGMTAFLFIRPPSSDVLQSPHQIMREPYHSMSFHLQNRTLSSKVHGSLSWGCVA